MSGAISPRTAMKRLLSIHWPRVASALGAMTFGIAAAEAPQPAEITPATATTLNTAIVAERLRPDEVITLDGTLSHPAWQRAPVHKASFERQPDNGVPAKYDTHVQVLFDERAVYVGVNALDPQPELIRESLVRHDQVRRTQDFVAVYIDPIGKRKSAQWFRAAASGSLSDGMQTADDDSEDFSPDFDFDAKVTRHTAGYVTVFRIPFASLRYASVAPGQTRAPWRMQVARRVPRQQIYLTMSVAMPQAANNFIEYMQDVQGLTPPADDSFLKLRPNLTVRRTTERRAGQPGSKDSKANLGLEMKWRPRPELVVDATLKPDFSQVELDVPRLSRNSQFALFLQEKRPFFLESSDLLRSLSDALYTRSVTLPQYGLRGTWRSEQVAGTALVARDRGQGLLLLPAVYGTGSALQPASHVAFARVRTDSDNLSVGAIASLRKYDDGAGANAVLGPDLHWQVSPATRIRAQALFSSTSAWTDASGALTNQGARGGHAAKVDLFWRGDGVEAGGAVEDKSANFRNDNGFLTQTGVRTFSVDAHKVWRGIAPLNELWLNLIVDQTQDLAKAQVVSQHVLPGVYTNYSNNAEFSLEYRGWTRTRLTATAPLLNEDYWHVFYSRSAALWAPQVNLEVDWGKLADVSAGVVRQGKRVVLSATLRPLARLELLPNYSLATLEQPDGERAYRESALRWMAIWHLTPQQSLRLISQRTSVRRSAEPANSIAGFADAGRTDSLTYTWRRSFGTVFYLGAGRGLAGVSPNLSRVTEVFAKLQVDVDEWRF
jgi:hypothetical protein